MDNGTVQLVGGPCGQHGPYTFYKSFRYIKGGVKRVMNLSEFFFVKLWIDSDLVCIGELQLLWMDKNSEQVLASLRLYFLPENTPEGRMDHGEEILVVKAIVYCITFIGLVNDEVLAISEKVVLRVEDLITWITIDAEWTWGRLAKTIEQTKDVKTEDSCTNSTSPNDATLELYDIETEKKNIESKCSEKRSSVVILSYPRYCRYRAMMKRIEGVEDTCLRMKEISELGGFSVPSENTRVLFCRDTFDYPELEGHELLCNHLAPKLKGRPRGKRKKRSVSPGSESNESECSLYNANLVQPSTSGIKSISHEDYANGARTSGTISTRRSARTYNDNSDAKTFLKKLAVFMKTNHTPIGRIPSLGYKELDLYAFYTKVQRLGGYDVVTTNRIWKSIFEDLGGNHTSTSAATVIRRHYERFLLSYERHVKGEDDKPLPVSERRRLKSKTSRASTSDAETSEGNSGSENSTLTSSTPNTQTDTNCSEVKDTFSEKGKTSSLRSVRVKSERAREARREAESLQKENAEVESVPLKVEPIEVKEEPKLNLIIEKNNEPITTAATPVQKIIQDKSPSPVESKEIPIFEPKDTKFEAEIIEVPKKITSNPEVIDLDSEVYKNFTSNNNNVSSEFITEIKKQKLDILKQGGLEVTAVRTSNTQSKETRPSVIQQTTQHRVDIIPNNVNAKLLNDRKQMPPPTISSLKRTEPVKKYVPNGHVPPKVVQSTSIYVPSEKTVYGDPKDIFQPTIHHVQAPVFAENSRITGGGILDLTVKSPQKPTVDVASFPFPGLSERDFSTYMRRGSYPPNIPKMNSNLEITLVGRNEMKNQKPDKYNAPIFQKPAVPRKRTMSENHLNSAKVPRMDDKSRTVYSTQMYPPREVKKDFEPTVHRNSTAKEVKQMAPQRFQIPPQPPLYYNPMMASNPKMAPQYMPSSIEQLYQNMLNQMYLPSMYRMPCIENFQLYSDFLQNSRFQFPFTPDTESPKK